MVSFSYATCKRSNRALEYFDCPMSCCSVFLLDNGHKIFVWVGKGASKDERAKGMQYGHVSAV